MKELRLPADTKHFEEAMDFVAVSVKERTSKQREIIQATLMAEESICPL